MKRVIGMVALSAMLLLSASAFAQTAMMGNFGSTSATGTTASGFGSMPAGWESMHFGALSNQTSMPNLSSMPALSDQDATWFGGMGNWMESLLTSF